MDWSIFKQIMTDKKCCLQYIELIGSYELFFIDEHVRYECRILKDPTDTTDLDDFLNNFKSNANKKIGIALDESNRPFSKIVTTSENWVYSPRSLDFYTSKYKSLYNRDHNGAGIDDGTDHGDALMKFFDASGTEMVKEESESDEEFQVRLTASCVKTYVDFEPTFDYDIFGCKLMIENAPSSRAYLWAIAVPDVPKAYGGSKEFMGGGMNLKMMETKCIAYTDGKSSKILKYDPTYHTNKIRIIVKHSAGEQIGLQMIYDFYVE